MVFVMSTTLAEFKQIAVVNTLRSCQLFTGLSQPDLENIADVSILKSLEKGDYLFHEGDPARGFYVVQRGAVNVHRVNAAGKEQIIHVFRAGESFAEVALATETGYPADARALEPTQVLLVQKGGILALVKRQPELTLRMLGSMSSHLRVLVGQLEDLTLKDVETPRQLAGQALPEAAERIACENRADHDQARAGGGTRHRERNFFPHARQVP
jgi:CRP/FNR family transcriptional regulator